MADGAEGLLGTSHDKTTLVLMKLPFLSVTCHVSADGTVEHLFRPVVVACHEGQFLGTEAECLDEEIALHLRHLRHLGLLQPSLQLHEVYPVAVLSQVSAKVNDTSQETAARKDMVHVFEEDGSQLQSLERPLCVFLLLTYNFAEFAFQCGAMQMHFVDVVEFGNGMGWRLLQQSPDLSEVTLREVEVVVVIIVFQTLREDVHHIMDVGEFDEFVPFEVRQHAYGLAVIKGTTTQDSDEIGFLNVVDCHWA